MSTLSEILTMVRTETGQSLASGHQSQNDAILTARINTAQRELALRYNFRGLNLEQDITLVADTASYSFPSKLGLNETMDAWCDFGSQWVPVTYGIGREEQSLYASDVTSWPVQRWEVRVSAADETQALVVWPTPSQAGKLRLSGQKAVADMATGSDVSTLDGTLIAFWVAAQILARQKAPDAEVMLARAQQLAANLEMRQAATSTGPNFGRRRTAQPRAGIDFIPPGT